MPAEDAIGLTGPEYEMDIERGKIRDFARAMSAPLPEFIDAPRPLIPASFLITAAYSWGYSLERPRGTVFEQIDHDLSVPLHAEESFRFHGALPRAGERLHCRASLENVWRKQGGRGGDLTFLTMLTEFRNPAGELVAEERSTTVTTATGRPASMSAATEPSSGKVSCDTFSTKTSRMPPQVRPTANASSSE